MTRLFLLVAVAIAQAQSVAVKLTPEPLEVSRERFGALKSVTLWNVRACNNSAESVRLDAIRIQMATDVPLLSKASALAVLKAKRSKRPLVVASNLAEMGGYAATAFLGSSWLPLLAVGRGIGQRVERELPPVFDVSELLEGTLDLAPSGQTGNCVERSVFAAKQRAVKAERFQLLTNGVSAYGAFPNLLNPGQPAQR